MRFFDLQPRAKFDIADTTDYYKSISPELAEDFVSEAEAVFLYLLVSAPTGSNRYAHLLDGRLKHWQLDRFPFVVFYIYDAETLCVLRVLHERMDFTARLFR